MRSKAGFQREMRNSIVNSIVDATFADSDTRLWRVDGDDMGKDYLMAMSMIPFMTRVFRLGRKREEKKVSCSRIFFH